jgi:hypothetical protein
MFKWSITIIIGNQKSSCSGARANFWRMPLRPFHKVKRTSPGETPSEIDNTKLQNQSHNPGRVFTPELIGHSIRGPFCDQKTKKSQSSLHKKWNHITGIRNHTRVRGPSKHGRTDLWWSRSLSIFLHHDSFSNSPARPLRTSPTFWDTDRRLVNKLELLGPALSMWIAHPFNVFRRLLT